MARYRQHQVVGAGAPGAGYYCQVVGAGGVPMLMPVAAPAAAAAAAPAGIHPALMHLNAAMMAAGPALGLAQAAPMPAAPMMVAQPDPGPAAWRGGQRAPGVYEPDEDLVPLPLIPDTNGGVFVAGGPTTITWVGRVQKPFQGQRLLASVTPNGMSVAGVVGLAQIYVGTDPQMAQIGSFNLAFYVPGAFGVRHQWTPAEPGIDINIPVTLSTYPTGTDSVFITMQVNGAILQ